MNIELYVLSATVTNGTRTYRSLGYKFNAFMVEPIATSIKKKIIDTFQMLKFTQKVNLFFLKITRPRNKLISLLKRASRGCWTMREIEIERKRSIFVQQQKQRPLDNEPYFTGWCCRAISDALFTDVERSKGWLLLREGWILLRCRVCSRIKCDTLFLFFFIFFFSPLFWSESIFIHAVIMVIFSYLQDLYWLRMAFLGRNCTAFND